MTSSENKALAIAQLAVYATLALPTQYILIKHGKRGILGWFYVCTFEILRLVGSGMELSKPGSAGAFIISSIGLSPLLLAALGILHEG